MVMDKNSALKTLTKVPTLCGSPSIQVWQLYDLAHSNIVNFHIKQSVCNPKESRPELDEEI